MAFPFESSQQSSQTAKPVSPETLPVILYHDVRVITTDLLAQLYGADVTQIYQNYANNKDRFVEGKHFFKLEGEELRQFKDLHYLDNIEVVKISPRAKHLTLWTERGAARHAKILDTDAAWDVFERLEDAYFKPRETRQTFGTGPQGELFDVPVDPNLIAKTFGGFIRVGKLGGLDLDQARLIADRETFKRLGVSPLAILNVDAPANQPSYTIVEPPDGPAMLTASALLANHERPWSAVAFNRALVQIGYAESRVQQIEDKPARRFIVLVDDGLSYGENVLYNPRYRVTSPLYYPDRFPSLLEIVEPVIEDQARQKIEAVSGSTAKMSQRQRLIYKDSGLADEIKTERKAEKRQQLRERKRREVIEGAQAGQPWREIRDASNLRKYFDAEELTELRALYIQHSPKGQPRPTVQDPGRTLPASLQPVDREAANHPDWLEPKDLIDPAVRADYKARNQYQPVSREQAQEFLIEEAKKFIAVGDDWQTFCFMRGRLFALAFNDAEVLSLQQAYERAFPTGEPLDWSGAV